MSSALGALSRKRARPPTPPPSAFSSPLPRQHRLQVRAGVALRIARDLFGRPPLHYFLPPFKVCARSRDERRQSRLFLQFDRDLQNGGLQRRQMLLNDVPNQSVGNPMVVMPQNVTDTHDLRPGDLRLTLLELRRYAASGLRHDLNAALYAMAKKPIAVEIVDRLASNRPLHAFDRIENGEKRRTNKPLGQKTRSADASIRSRSRGSRLSRVVMSTGTPSLRSRSCLMPTNSTREKWLPRSYSMKRSRSLWDAALSRAVDPNI